MGRAHAIGMKQIGPFTMDIESSHFYRPCSKLPNLSFHNGMFTEAVFAHTLFMIISGAVATDRVMFE
jgi:hypothetical protein